MASSVALADSFFGFLAVLVLPFEVVFDEAVVAFFVVDVALDVALDVTLAVALDVTLAVALDVDLVPLADRFASPPFTWAITTPMTI